MVVLYKNGLVISIARVASFSERLNSHHRSAPLKFSYEQINFEILLKELEAHPKYKSNKNNGK
jgi:hypothetical protein